jgi:hypothetical protein
MYPRPPATEFSRKIENGRKERSIHRYPIATPQRWPRKLVLGTKMAVMIMMTRGEIHVGILYELILSSS